MSSDPHEASIRVQVLGGVWETIGSDRYRGVAAEGLQMSSNAWGADTCSFTLRRDPAAVHPDLIAWTPVEVWIGGVLVWDGRVKETPAQEGADFSLNVQCEGWQYHLDDDVYSKTYVQTRMSDWVDYRSMPLANLTGFGAAPSVTTGGAITLAFSANVAVASDGRVGVVLDFGPTSQAKRIVFVMDAFNTHATQLLQVNASDDPSNLLADTVNNTTLGTGGTLAASTTAATLTTARRYITIHLHNNGAAFTPTADEFVHLTSIQLFADTAYESGNASILKADQIVKDALTQATVLLSSDVSNVSAGTFSIPEFTMSDYQTPREVISAANAYENFETKMLPGRRVAFRARAAAPAYEIGEWSGADFADASTNSGDDIFNKVVVQGTGPDGASLSTIRYASQSGGAALVSAAQLPNPGFEVDTTNWTPGTNNTITRDTVIFDTGVASGRWDWAGPALAYLYAATTGTFVVGVSYRIDFRARDIAANVQVCLVASVGGVPITPSGQLVAGSAGSFHSYSYSFAVTTAVTNPFIRFYAPTP